MFPYIKEMLNKLDVVAVTGFDHLRRETCTRCYCQGKGTSGGVERREFLDWLRNCHLSKEDFAPLN
jgi:hypothetical protein